MTFNDMTVTDRAPDLRSSDMNVQVLNAHTRFEIAVQQALSRLSWELRQIVMRAECAAEGSARPDPEDEPK